jgi:RNA polymerase primary sigma factor
MTPEEIELKVDLERALSKLPEREREVLKMHFGLDDGHPLSFNKIGLRFNVCGTTIRRIANMALRRLRTHKRSKLLKDYLAIH